MSSQLNPLPEIILDNRSSISLSSSSDSDSDSEHASMPGAFPAASSHATRRFSYPPQRNQSYDHVAVSATKDKVNTIGFFPTYQELVNTPFALGQSSKDPYPEEPEPILRDRYCGICNEQVDIYEEPLKAQEIRSQRENQQRINTTQKYRRHRWSQVNVADYMATMGRYSSELPEKKNLVGTSLCNAEPMYHAFCLDCASKFIRTNLESGAEGNFVLPIRCPSCPWYGEQDGTEVSDEHANKILNKDDLAEWYFRQLIESTKYIYCPNPRCSVPLEPSEDATMDKSCCGSCHTVLCIPCRSVDHPGQSCKKFQKSRKSDPIVKEERAVKHLARKLRWRKCPKCQHIVERASGCDHMTCKCKHEFCYRCGSNWEFGCSQRFCRFFRSGDFTYEVLNLVIMPYDHVRDGLSSIKSHVVTSFRRIRRRI